MQNFIQFTYEKTAEGVKLKSKCQWYEGVNNQLKLFLILKKRSVKELVRKLDEDEKKKLVIKQNHTMKLRYSLKSSLNVIRIN